MMVIELVKTYLWNRTLLDKSSEDIRQLIKFILEHNVFTLKGEYFLQVCGTVMDTRMAPCHAYIIMAELEENFLHSCPCKSLPITGWILCIILLTA